MFQSVKSRVGLILALASAMSAPVLATTPTMPAVDFPVDLASIITSIATAGATMLVLVFGIQIGFYLAKKLFRRAKASV